jgi:hypothetical protein
MYIYNNHLSHLHRYQNALAAAAVQSLSKRQELKIYMSFIPTQILGSFTGNTGNTGSKPLFNPIKKDSKQRAAGRGDKYRSTCSVDLPLQCAISLGG